MFKNIVVKLKDKDNKLIFNKRWELYLYMPLIKFKGIKVLKRSDKIIKVINMNKLSIKYKDFIIAMKAQDNLNQNTFDLKENYLIENKYLNLVEDKNKVMKLYSHKESNDEINSKLIKYMGKNIIEESNNDLKNRKMSNRFSLPHYFFTGRYNEKNMPSQNRSWNNSVYNFLKIEKSSIKFLDVYSAKLIKLFFNIKYIQRKKIWDIILLNGLKIKPNLSVIKDMNIIIKYTSSRSSWSLKNLSYYPSIILTFTWLLEQIKFSSNIRKIITDRKEGIISGFKIKKKNYIRKLDKVFISKPLFKHTSFNVIIDLFVYNNKTNKLQKFENILSRRILYKYMYSMYVDSKNKIKETLNRPRFFYLNLIEPKIFNYYSNIIKLYENILVINAKDNFYYLCLLILKWNFICKNNFQYLKNKYLFFKFNEIKNIKENINKEINNYLLYKDEKYNCNYNNIINTEENKICEKETFLNLNIMNKKKIRIILFKRRNINKNKFLYKYNNYYYLNAKYINIKNNYLKCIDVYTTNKDKFIYEKKKIWKRIIK